MPQVFKKKSKRELLGFVSLEKRIAQLHLAGLRNLVARDQLYDSVDGREEVLETAPPFPRHFEADMAEVSDLYRMYADRRAEAEVRIAERKAAVKEKASQMNPDEVKPSEK